MRSAAASAGSAGGSGRNETGAEWGTIAAAAADASGTDGVFEGVEVEGFGIRPNGTTVTTRGSARDQRIFTRGARRRSVRRVGADSESAESESAYYR